MPIRWPCCFWFFLGARRLINSPFGLALRGIRENWVRMPAIGADSRAHIRKAYTIAAIIAGLCGALLAQTTDNVSLESISFQRSADVLVMLVLGGAGRLYGGLVGAAIFMIARDQFSGIAPQFWYFWIGILLVVVVMLLPNGILGGLSKIVARWRRASERARPLSTRGLSMSFGSLVVARDIELNLPVGARYALIGPNGAGKTTLINLMTGMLAPNAGQIFLGRRRHHRAGAAGAGAARARAHLPDQHAVRRPQPARSGDACRGGAPRHRRQVLAKHRGHKEAIEEAYDILVKLRLGDCCYQPTRELPYGRQRLLEIALALATKPKVLLLDEPAAGVPQEESGDIFEVVASLSDDLTLLFIEHDMHVVFRFATHIIVLVGGAIFTQGSPAEIAADPGVREVYLGKRKHG